jgi:hypothetical protein
MANLLSSNWTQQMSKTIFTIAISYIYTTMETQKDLKQNDILRTVTVEHVWNWINGFQLESIIHMHYPSASATYTASRPNYSWLLESSFCSTLNLQLIFSSLSYKCNNVYSKNKTNPRSRQTPSILPCHHVICNMGILVPSFEFHPYSNSPGNKLF